MIDSYIFGFLLSKINVNLFWTSGPIAVQIRLKKVHECCLYIDSSSVPVRDPWLRMVKLEKILKLRPKNWCINTWLKSDQSAQSAQILGTCSCWPQRSFEGHLNSFRWPSNDLLTIDLESTRLELSNDIYHVRIWKNQHHRGYDLQMTFKWPPSLKTITDS